MATKITPVLIALGIQKGTNARQPITAAAWTEIPGIGRIDVDLNEHQFAHLMGGSVIETVGQWDDELSETAADPTPHADSIAVLSELRDQLPPWHPDRMGVLRSIELLRSLAQVPTS